MFLNNSDVIKQFCVLCYQETTCYRETKIQCTIPYLMSANGDCRHRFFKPLNYAWCIAVSFWARKMHHRASLCATSVVFCTRFDKNFNVKNGSRSWRETRVPCSLEIHKFAAANIPRFWLLYASSPSRTCSRSRSLSKGFNIQGEARMNIHERTGDCTVILINCTLNPVEMDH